MPRRRRFTRRRRKFRRRRIRRMRRPARELKWLDTAISGTSGTTWGNHAVSLNVVPQGLTANDRIGDKLTIRSIEMNLRVHVTFGTSISNSVQRARVLLVHDRQANLLPADGLELMEDDSVDSFRNETNSHRFRILRDWKVTTVATAAGGDGTSFDFTPQHRWLRFRKRLNMPIKYEGASGAITTTQSNNLCLFVIVESSLATTLTGITRIRFSDS